MSEDSTLLRRERAEMCDSVIADRAPPHTIVRVSEVGNALRKPIEADVAGRPATAPLLRTTKIGVQVGTQTSQRTREFD